MKALMIGLLSLSLCGTANAAGDPVAGKSKSLICSGCHLRDGNSKNSNYPILAGQGQAYLIKQLMDFKSGARKEEHMSPIVEAVNAEDIKDIAAYYSSQPRSPLTGAPKAAASGKQLFQDGNKDVSACSGCHGADGKGNPALKFPSLAGQHPEYTAKMLKEFRSAARSNDQQAVMRDSAKGLTDSDIETLAAYIATLP